VKHSKLLNLLSSKLERCYTSEVLHTNFQIKRWKGYRVGNRNPCVFFRAFFFLVRKHSADQGLRTIRQESDARDDEQAATQYLQHGVKPGFKVSKTKTTRVTRSDPASKTPAPQSPTPSRTKSKNGKAKEESEDGDSTYEEKAKDGEKGKKRALRNGGGGASKKPKLVADVPEKEVSKKKSKEGEQEAKEKGGKKLGEKRKVRKTGPAGPGLGSLKKADLLKKIHELEDKITNGELERDDDSEDEEEEEDEDETMIPVPKGTKTRKTVVSNKKMDHKGKGKEKDEDSEELTDLEESQIEEQQARAQSHVRRSKSPSPVTRNPTASASTRPLQRRATSADPLPPRHLSRIPSSVPRRSLPGGAGGAAATDEHLQSSTPELSRLRLELEEAKRKANVNHEQKKLDTASQ
jgi:hypothetical protein